MSSRQSHVNLNSLAAVLSWGWAYLLGGGGVITVVAGHGLLAMGSPRSRPRE